MKLKTLIGMLAVAGAMTGFTATDAELKAMLDAKDYDNFIKNANVKQVCSFADSNNVETIVRTLTKHNPPTTIFKALADSKVISYKEIIDICLSSKYENTIVVADFANDEKLLVDTWRAVLDIPETDIKRLSNVIMGKKQIKAQNFELTKNTAEKLLAIKSGNYTLFIYNIDYSYLSDADIEWMKTSANNVSANLSNLAGWVFLRQFDSHVVKTGFSDSPKYYFNEYWKLHKIDDMGLVGVLWSADYRDEALNTWASSVTDPVTAYYSLALPTDKLAKNKEMTKRVFHVIAKDIHLGLSAAIYLADADKVIDILLIVKEELTADEINSVIPMINSLDADYRKNDVIKALRNINARYTLNLYDDHKTWEPILSKIRALIDVRQM